jgi:hypothetical protein
MVLNLNRNKNNYLRKRAGEEKLILNVYQFSYALTQNSNGVEIHKKPQTQLEYWKSFQFYCKVYYVYYVHMYLYRETEI